MQAHTDTAFHLFIRLYFDFSFNCLDDTLDFAASDFAAAANNIQSFTGLGTTSYLSSYSPNLFENDIRIGKPYDLIPVNSFDKTELQNVVNILKDCITVKTDLGCVHETGSTGAETIQKDHLEKIIVLSSGLVTTTGKKSNRTLASYNCHDGFASQRSIPDGVNVIDEEARGIFEVKANTAAPCDATRQAISEAYNLAIRQLRLGIKYTDIMIPIVGSNGYLMEFSCLILLPPSFPLVVKLSKVLDINNQNDCNIAAGYLININKFYKIKIDCNENAPSQLVNLYNNKEAGGLSGEIYYLKQLTHFFQSKDNLDRSIMHLFMVMQHLYVNLDSIYREYVLFPICVRIVDENIRNGAIVFPKLNEDEWKIGLPCNESQRNDFFVKLEAIMEKIHEAGIVHYDYYLSNFMWKVDSNDSNKICLKIIDWDSAHLTSEFLSTNVTQRLFNGRYELATKLGPDPKNYDISLYNILYENRNNIGLQENKKYKLDEKFKLLVQNKFKLIGALSQSQNDELELSIVSLSLDD